MAKKTTEPATIRRFPGTLFIRREQEPGEEEYFLADTTVSGEDGDLIGIYHLTEVKCKRVTTTLEAVE